MSDKSVFPLNLPALLNDLVALKQDRFPQKLHFAVKCDEHSRETYATLLAALLLNGGQISAGQSGVFKMLLNSLQLEDIQPKLFERAQTLNQDALREFLRVVDQNGLAISFFMDALVLCRLDAPLTDGQHQLLSELADLLHMLEDDLAVIANLAAIALGLPCTSDIPLGFDYAKVQAWYDFLFRPLTAERLASGVVTGLWKITEPLRLTTAWRMEKAHVRFDENGSLDTNAAGQVVIDHSHLERPLMVFGGALTFSMNYTEITGDYPEFSGKTAFVFDGISNAAFCDLNVLTRHARSFLIQKSYVSFVRCNFIDCGSSKLIGGAVAVSGDCKIYECDDRKWISGIYVNSSNFTRCVARLGGGIRADELNVNSIINTNFDGCISLAYHLKDISKDLEGYAFGGGSLFANTVKTIYSSSSSSYSCIVGCSFKNTSINLGQCGGVNDAYDMRDTKIEDCYVVHTSHRSNIRGDFRNRFSDCNGKMVVRESQPWWNEY